MIARKRGAIVNISSLAAHNGGGPGASIYAAAKAAIDHPHQGAREGTGAARHPRERRVARADRRHAVPPHVHRRRRRSRPPRRRSRSAAPARPTRSRTSSPSSSATRRVVPRRRDDRDQRRHVHAVSAMKISGLRWFVITLIFLATVINYIDRQTMSVLKTRHQHRPRTVELRLRRDPEQLPAVLRHQPDGLGPHLRSHRHAARLRLLDRGLVGAAIMHAFAAHAAGVQLWRAVLGFGEAGNWPGAAKAVGEWFPVNERAFGMGIFNAGAALGGAVSPPIIAWLALAYGWRSTFIVTGAARLRVAGAAGCCCSRSPETAPLDHRGGARATSSRTSSRTGTGASTGSRLGHVAHLSPDVGGRARAVHHRSDLVALHLLAAELLPGSARVQPAADRRVGVAAVPVAPASARSAADGRRAT